MENEVNNQVAAPQGEQAPLLIDGIPEEYFRAFIGKNADYYLSRFSIIYNTLRSNRSTTRKWMHIDKDYGNITIAFIIFGGLPIYLFYRKMYLYSAIWITLAFIFQILIRYYNARYLLFGIWGGVHIFFTLQSTKLFYRHSINLLKDIMSKPISHQEKLDIATKKGGVNFSAMIAYLIISMTLGYFGLLYPSFLFGFNRV
jgi:hypothetical protein